MVGCSRHHGTITANPYQESIRTLVLIVMLSLTSFGPAYRALVVGSSGAIGAAFVRALRADPACALVSEMARSANSRSMHALPFQLEDEVSIQKAAEQLLPLGPYHLIIDATGALEIDNTGMEWGEKKYG